MNLILVFLSLVRLDSSTRIQSEINAKITFGNSIEINMKWKKKKKRNIFMTRLARLTFNKLNKSNDSVCQIENNSIKY